MQWTAGEPCTTVCQLALGPHGEALDSARTIPRSTPSRVSRRGGIPLQMSVVYEPLFARVTSPYTLGSIFCVTSL